MALHLEDFLITGRTFEEYLDFFNLSIETLENKKILDCPSGVSSFIATAHQHGIEAYGCDIIYQFDPEAIVKQAELSIQKIYEDVTWMEGFNFSFYGSVDKHKEFRTQALNHFVEDINKPYYSYETLPSLSYEDDAFDLLLSSHLLFVYDDRMSLEFHIQSIQEMLRVAKEVRIFPLVDFKNSHHKEEKNFSPLVYEVLKHFSAEIILVDFEFQPGANAMLCIQR